MSNRDFGFIALGRFMACERYRDTHPASTTGPLRSAGMDRTGADADKPDSGGRTRAPARAQHR